MFHYKRQVIDKILEFFEFKQFNWPQISDKKDLEKFMNILAKKYHVSKVNVHIETKEWIRDWSQSKFMHVILHEFVHLFLRENFPWIEESHGPDFAWWESRLALEYGLKVKRRKGISYV